jgi:hypothetical protein
MSRVPGRGGEENAVIDTHILRAKSPLALIILALALPAAGCGGGGDDKPSHPADDQQLVEQASQKIERAAAASAGRVKDRYIPGPKRFKVVCLTPEMAAAKKVTAEFIQCHVESFSTPSKARPESVYVESEDWRVAVDNEAVGEPVIVDGYRIRDFLRRDNRLGCSVGKAPQERCKSPFAG